MFLDSSLIFEKVSMIAKVASMACLLRSMVAIMYKPFSVRALGATLVFANFAVENFDRKSANSTSLKLKHVILWISLCYSPQFIPYSCDFPYHSNPADLVAVLFYPYPQGFDPHTVRVVVRTAGEIFCGIHAAWFTMS